MGAGYLSDIPRDWELRRIGSLFIERKELVGAKAHDFLLLSLTLRGVIPRDMINVSGKLPADFESYQVVRERDIVFCLFDVEETPRTVGLATRSGMVTGAYTVMAPADNAADPTFVAYAYFSYDQSKALRPLYAGLRNTIRKQDFRNIVVPLPPIEEQVAIVAFLDRETAEIDAFIADQEELIGVLAERRAATISHAVTKGLDLSVLMKDSGVPWLGSVPEHWSVGQLKNVGELVLGKMLQPVESPSAPILYRYMRAANVQPDGHLDLKTSKEMWFSASEIRRLALRRGDVVIVEGGVGGYGRASFVYKDLVGWAFQNSIIRLTPNPECDGRFVTFVFLHLRRVGYIEMVASVTSMPHFTLDKAEKTQIAWPDLDEQSRICDYLDRETAELDAAFAEAREAVALSRERRAALISAAVTGKIDVRDEVWLQTTKRE